MQTIDKKRLIKEPLDKDTLKLAQAIYSTYIANEKDPYMYISLKRLFNLFGFDDSSASLSKIIEIFIDLTEPIAVENFEYGGRKYPKIILTFCTFEEIQKDGDGHMEIELNEMYLEAMKNYMLDPFLDIK
ncbi:hypothetical protein [Sulfurimonas sp. HSL-1716]|uniref:hypothetical protein n=1 Tax=Hydrocurvibacter sulfurireducens TaxID=3131937 RepID=UPI0031F9B80D